MGFRNYIGSSVLLIAIVAIYSGFSIQGDYTIIVDLYGFYPSIEFTLPIFIWMILPISLLFILSIFHMLYYGTKGYIQRNIMKKDIEKVILAIKDRLLKKESKVTFKTDELKEFNSIINQLTVEPLNESIDTTSKDIKNIVNMLAKINNNEYIPAKELKLENENVITKINTNNRIINDPNFAIEVIKESQKYDTKSLQLAFDQIIEHKSINAIKKAISNFKLTDEMTNLLLLKDSRSSAEMCFTNDEIIKLIEEHTLSNMQLIEIAKNYQNIISPEQLIKLFEDISSGNEKYLPSYLYVLFSYEMIDQAREILANTPKEKFSIFKAMLDLKDSGKHYTLDSFTFE